MKSDMLEGRIKELEKRLEEQAKTIAEIKLSAIPMAAEDIGSVEAIFDVLATPRVALGGKPIVTQSEIIHYLDVYKQAWTTIVHILIDKKITTPKELNCAIIAYHHFLRMYGMNTGMTQEELFTARQKYIQELMALPDPIAAIGR